MYGLPKDFDGGFFLGSALEQICVSANTMSLHFNRDIMVTVEGDYSCREIAGSTAIKANRVPAFNADLTRLLEQIITDVAGSTDGTLELTFANGYRLAIYDTPQYEAYHIKHREHVITV